MGIITSRFSKSSAKSICVCRAARNGGASDITAPAIKIKTPAPLDTNRIVFSALLCELSVSALSFSFALTVDD
jgi:hypothetical protein